LFFVISSGSVATLAVAFADYLRQFVPLDPTARKLAAALMIAVVGAVNVRGTRHSANIQNWSTGIKVAAILAISVVLLGSGHGRLIAAAVLVAMFSAANGLTLTNSRVYYAMARDGVFFRKLAEVHPRFGTPAFSVLVSSAWAIGLAATGSFEQLFTYVIFSAWIFYALAGASVFVLRRSRPDAPRP